jgi:hypothetical protein
LSTNFYDSKDVWKANSFSAEPIGPYVAGTLFDGTMKVIKNQDYDDNIALLGYKRDDVDASWCVGSFISLYSTQPLAKDDLCVVQGLGTKMGAVPLFQNSTMRLIIE